jgi:hypothetical protein
MERHHRQGEYQDQLSCLRRKSKQLEHDPEKWKPVFRKDHAVKILERQAMQSEKITL